MGNSYSIDLSRRLLLLVIVLLPLMVAAQSGIVFKENKGQWDPEVMYAANVPGGTVFFTQEGLVFNICEQNSTLIENRM